MARQNRVTRQDAVRKVTRGLLKYYGNVQELRLAGATYTPAALAQLLQADTAASTATALARAAWVKAAATEKATQAKTDPVLRAIRHVVLGDHGDTKAAGDVLAAFGYAPRKSRKPSSAELVATAAKVKATRAARGTKGKRQKAKIKGTN